MRKKIFLLVLLLIYGICIVELISVLPKKQNFQAGASATTTLSFSPSSSLINPIKKKVGDTVSLDIMLNPGNNYVSIVKLQIVYNTSKFHDSGANTLVVNQNALPVTIDGPLMETDSGEIKVTLSVGTDPQKALKTPVKLATLNLITRDTTDTSYNLVTFGLETEAFSVGPTDHAYENIVANAIPAYITIGEIITTPTPPATTPTKVPSPTIRITPTLPPPTPTFPPNATVLSFNALLHGIGNSGDSSNPTNSSLSNKNPLPTRPFTVTIYDSTNRLVATKNTTFYYDKNSGSFRGNVLMEDTFAAGSYLIKLQTDRYLRVLIPGIHLIAKAKNNILPTITLIAGDITGDNLINILDYNILMNCYSDLKPRTSSCSSAHKVSSDLNDDGLVNQVDYNLFLREIGTQSGD